MIGPEDGHFAADAWTAVAGQVEGAQPQLERFRSQLVGAFVLGATSRETSKLLISVLADADWHWPWFEDWAERFDREGQWPLFWPLPALDEDEDPADYTSMELTGLRREATAPLLINTALSVAYRNKHISQHPKGWGWRLVTIGDDPIENRYAAIHQPAIQAADLSALPPYFPSDRTALQTVPPYAKDT